MTLMLSPTTMSARSWLPRSEQTVETSNHAAVAVFRQAFAGDTEAWATIYTQYTPLVRHWIGVQQVIDPEEVAQEAWMAFARYAPRHPSLVQEESPRRVLAYLRTCVKTAIVTLCRREKRHAITAYLDDVDSVLPVDSMDSAMVQRMAIQERVQQLLMDDDERFIFHLRFVSGMKPQAIAAAYPERFSDVKIVYVLIGQLVRRLRADHILQSLCSSSSGVNRERKP